MMLRRLMSLMPLSALLVQGGFSHAATLEYVSGHGDIGLAYDGELELHYHLDNATLDGMPSGDVEFQPDEVHIRITDAAIRDDLPSTIFSPLGLTAVQDIYWLEDESQTDLPFIGIASEELVPDPPEMTLFNAARLTMSDFSGPGAFGLINIGLSGPEFLMNSSDGANLNPGEDVLDLAFGSHQHFFWAFTEPGVYDITLSAEADFIAGGLPATDQETFRFVIGTSTAIPEPGSMVVLAMVTGGLLSFRRRRQLSTLTI